MRCHKLLRISTAVAILIFVQGPPSMMARLTRSEKKEPVMATSDHDEKLHQMLLALSPGNIRDDEARAVTACAYNTGRDLKREWRVVYPPGVQNYLVNTGRRPGGLCFQFATVLLLRLDALKLQTLELHWAEAFAREGGEHNVIVVTAKGQPFERGVILDNWREGGNLIYGLAAADPHYRWKENSFEAARRLRTRSIAPM